MVAIQSHEVVFARMGRRHCLDFVNTMHNYGVREARDDIKSYSDLVSWSEQAGILNRKEAERLLREWRRQPKDATLVLRQATALRDVIYRIFSAVAAELSPRAADLAALNAILSHALQYSQIAPLTHGFIWSWQSPKDALDRMLWPVARWAAELLTSEDLHRVRECGGESCTWLFLDMSRNHSRRWCDMKSCGNRAKAHRHYERTRTLRKS